MARNKLKANAVYAFAETLLIAATLAGGIVAYELLANIPTLLAVIGAIAAAFVTDVFVAPMIGDVFNPAIDRLRGLEPEGADQS
ncbi:hypothetical protein ACFC8N_42740 [Streptomyces sp. NPDC055966]|uniref:hypothetical protein n=1 Tax=Streptomyces sp. NPDC055966 TaxID=3345669 RepID=UPI0035DF037B